MENWSNCKIRAQSISQHARADVMVMFMWLWNVRFLHYLEDTLSHEIPPVAIIAVVFWHIGVVYTSIVNTYGHTFVGEGRND